MFLLATRYKEGWNLSTIDTEDLAHYLFQCAITHHSKAVLFNSKREVIVAGYNDEKR